MSVGVVEAARKLGMLAPGRAVESGRLSAPRPAHEKHPVVLFGRRISRDSAVYAAGLMAVLPASLLNAIVLTHLLTPGEYGDLGVLLIFAGFLTILENLGTLQGTFAYVYGAGDDEGETDEENPSGVRDKRRAMTSGFAVTLATVGLVSVPLIAFSGAVGSWLVGDGAGSGLLVWAVCSAGAGALWRLSINVLRLERRPVAFALLNALRPLLVMAISVPLVASGAGIQGALVGTTLGTLGGVVLALAVGPRVLKPAVSRSDMLGIWRFGGRRVPVIMALWTLTNADLFWLSRFGGDVNLGAYRLASRFGSVPSYFTSAYLMAWGSLRRSSAYKAAFEARPAEIKSRLITYFVVLTLSIVLVLGLASSALVGLAPDSYDSAAPLIPLIALSLLGYGIYVLLNRTARYRHKQLVYGTTAVAAAVLMGLLSWVLIPPLGAYGAVLAVCLALLAACAVVIVAIQRGKEPLPLEWRRMATAFVLAAGAYLLSLRGPDLLALPHAVFALLGLALFVLGVVALGVLPRSELAPLRTTLGGAMPSRAPGRDLGRRVRNLSLRDRQALARALGVERVPPGAAEGLDGYRDAVRVLRGLDELGDPGPDDAALGEYLFSTGARIDLDPVAQDLWERVPPADMHRLELTVERLRALPDRTWHS
jgi:O-antigen/teichoic acid export membrane protein